MLAQRTLPADHQERALSTKGIGDAGHGVGRARPRRRHDTADLAALARVAVGGVGRHLFMAHVDDFDPLVDAAVVDVDDMAAAERPDHLDAFVFERLGDQMSTGDHRAGRFAFTAAWSCHGSLAWAGFRVSLLNTEYRQLSQGVCT